MNLTKIKKIHFTGIKGVGMTALALIFQDIGIKVSGSDIGEIFVTDEILRKRKISFNAGFDKKNLPEETDLVVFTAAHGGRANIEVLAAEEREIPAWTQAQTIGWLMKDKIGISVCGVGGKSTTAAMLSVVLDSAGLYPSFFVGVAKINSLGSAGRYDHKGKYFVAEADEYFDPVADCPKFFFQKPQIIILTNIEHDHPDVYPDLKSTLQAYKTFIEKLPDNGLLVANVDNQNIEELLKSLKPLKVLTYGFSPKADYLIKNYKISNNKASFEIKRKKYLLNVPGKFNAANAAAVIIAAGHLGIDYKKIKKGLQLFGGTKRRFEKIIQIKGISLYDDYAHHPSEIKATLKAVKKWLPLHRVIVIFQPHTYSRTKQFLKDFANSFKDADFAIITDIYPSARENPDKTISGLLLANEIKRNNKKVYFKDGCQSVCQWLKDNTKKGDLIFTLGAGDIFLWHDKIIKSLK